MYFYDDSHETNFREMLERFPIGKKDPEYKVACYVISHPEIFPKASKEVEWDAPFEGDWMETNDFSSGIRLLIDLGFHLFGGGSHPFNLMDGLSTWDTGNFQVFQQACEIRNGWA